MNRKGEQTRLTIMDAAAALFAERGIDGVTMAELHETTQQRNKSAVQYHFGSRDGLVGAILQRYQDVAGEQRSRMLAAADHADLTSLTAALVEPALINLRSEGGRNYLRMVPHVAIRYSALDGLQHVGDVMHENLAQIDALLVDLEEGVRVIRLTSALNLLIHQMARRARAVDERAPLLVDEATFSANLVAMIVGLLSAPLAGSEPEPVSAGATATV